MWFLNACSSSLLLLGAVMVMTSPWQYPPLTKHFCAVYTPIPVSWQRLPHKPSPASFFPYWTQLWLDIESPLLLPEFSCSYFLFWLFPGVFPYFCPQCIFLPFCPSLSYLLFITFAFPRSFHGQSCPAGCELSPVSVAEGTVRWEGFGEQRSLGWARCRVGSQITLQVSIIPGE